MSVANLSLLQQLGSVGFWNTDDEIVLPSTALNTQTGAYPVRGETVRVTVAPATASMILRSVISGDAAPMTFVVNDSANAINVFPAVGEQNNGVTNAALSIPARQTG